LRDLVCEIVHSIERHVLEHAQGYGSGERVADSDAILHLDGQAVVVRSGARFKEQAAVGASCQGYEPEIELHSQPFQLGPGGQQVLEHLADAE